MTARTLWTRCLVVTAALGVSGLPLHAQSAQSWSVQGSLLAANQSLNGKLISGIGFEGQLRFTPSVWSVGAGVQYSSHSSNGETLNLSGLFVEPRYALDVGSDRFAPYLAGRIALLHESSNLNNAPNVSSNGFAFGGGAGFLIRASKTVNFDFGAAIVSQSLDNATASNGNVVAFKTFAGYILKGGVSIGFGGGK